MQVEEVTRQVYWLYGTYEKNLIDFVPSSLVEALSQPVWVDAMLEEYDSIMKNSIWEVVLRLDIKSLVVPRWIYKVKHETDAIIEKYKVIFTAKGFSQVEGVDNEEKFSPVTRYSSIKTILTLDAHMGWKIHQKDVKIVFLNGVVEEEIYIEHLEGFETHDRETHVCRLRRALYGIK